MKHCRLVGDTCQEPYRVTIESRYWNKFQQLERRNSSFADSCPRKRPVGTDSTFPLQWQWRGFMIKNRLFSISQQ